MWEKIFNLAINNGLWAVLFLVLLFYVLKDSRAREKKYQETIEKLGNCVAVVEDIKEDVKQIKLTIESKPVVFRKKREVKNNEEI